MWQRPKSYVSVESPLMVLFFSLFVDTQDIHSFPTRRSSDLRIRTCSARIAFSYCPAPRPGPSPPQCRTRRSEEHTSELQSLTNIVCRLLLEKKTKSASAILPVTNITGVNTYHNDL